MLGSEFYALPDAVEERRDGGWGGRERRTPYTRVIL